MKYVTIYTLSCPKTGVVKYVGMTSSSLEKRLYNHIHIPASTRMAYWFYTVNHAPIIEEIEVCESSIGKQVEKYWIEQMNAWGFELLNGEYKRQLECPYTQEDLERWRERERRQTEGMLMIFD